MLPRPGGYFLAVAGVQHKTWIIPLLLERPGDLELEVRLGPADFESTFDSVRVVGSFNNFAKENAIPMTRRPGGTFAAMVACSSDSLRYQLLGVQAGGDPVCGTQADTFVVDRSQPLFENGSSSFVSVLRADRQPVQVVFDPSRLPRGGAGAACVFSDTLGHAARILAIHMDIVRRVSRRTAAYSAFKAAGGAADSFQWGAPSDVKDLATQVDREQDPVLRGFLLLKCVQFLPIDIDSTYARRILVEVPPDSPLWSLLWGGPGNTFYDMARAANDAEAVRKYGERVVDVHPDSSVRAAVLYELLDEAHRKGDLERAGRYYTRMVSEFAGTRLAERARKQFGPSRAILKGNAAPDFAFEALEDSTHAYRAGDLRGKFVLIDFWATWCGPCVAELPYLRRAHEKYHARGLVILSVSFDEKRDTVKRLRGSKWLMPWSSAFDPRGFAGPAARAFEIVGIPRPILIDPEGRIVAADDELRGETLDKTLASVMAGRPAGAPHRN